MMDQVITFHEDGTVSAIYTDRIAEWLRTLGDVEIRRASDVEPDGDGWSAWIREWVPGPERKLGPFPTREEALAAEVKYLQEVL